MKPITDAVVSLRVTEPGGHERAMAAALTDPSTGRYAAAVRFDQPGVYSVAADIRRASDRLGPVSRSMLVGGVDVELAQPRLNDSVLRRIADTTHGQHAPAAEARSVAAMVSAPTPAGRRPRCAICGTTDSASLSIGLLAAEWIVRRRVGLA